jgi:hypothetical protein
MDCMAGDYATSQGYLSDDNVCGQLNKKYWQRFMYAVVDGSCSCFSASKPIILMCMG